LLCLGAYVQHIHLLLRTGLAPVASLMNRLLTGYARWFNRKYKRHGQLFQNRYKSFLCQEDLYLKELVRYIHLNPLKSGIVKDLKALDEHPCCGHSVVMNPKGQSWQDIDFVYGLFSDQKKSARKRYRSFVEKGVNQGRRSDLTGGGLARSNGGWKALKGLREAGIRVKGDERILGDSDFVEYVLKTAKEKLEQKYDLKAQGFDFGHIVERVAEVLAMAPDAVTAYGKSPSTVKARALLCFWAHRNLGMTTVEIAENLNICQPAVSRLSRKGETIARELGVEFIKQYKTD
jgi:putative transposase